MSPSPLPADELNHIQYVQWYYTSWTHGVCRFLIDTNIDVVMISIYITIQWGIHIVNKMDEKRMPEPENCDRKDIIVN